MISSEVTPSRAACRRIMALCAAGFGVAGAAILFRRRRTQRPRLLPRSRAARANVMKVLGKAADDIVSSGDEVADADTRQRFTSDV